MNVERLGISGVLAIITTVSLLFLMTALIAFNQTVPDEIVSRKVADIHMPERHIETQYDTAKPEKPKTPDEPPPAIPPPKFERPDVPPDVLDMSAPNVKPDFNIKGIGGFGSDGEYLPIVKVQPVYPRRALSRGIEGYVIVEFTVATNGTVREPLIIEAIPANIFNRAAVKAVLKFKYKPRVIDGEAVEVAGVRNMITFALAK